MYHSINKGEMPWAGETPILVHINGIPYWQASSGRTFPQVAGAEDPPSDTNTGDTGEDADSDAEKWDEERAKRTLAKLREKERDAEKASKAQLKELADLKAKLKQHEDEQLSETERLRARTAELEAAAAAKDRELQETRNRSAIERAAAKAGVVDPEDVHKLLNTSEFEHDDDGNVTNAEKLVAALLKAKPYLAGKATSGVPGTPRPNGTQSHEERVKQAQTELRASGRYAPLG